MITLKQDDGGRSAAGYTGDTRDCVTRAIAIATGRPYREVYDLIIEMAATERPRTESQRSHPRTGVMTHKAAFKRMMRELGFEWTATMKIGSGCKVHLRTDELPQGRLVVHVSKHSCAVIDGVLHDTHDCSRDGTRCVYGYWKLSGTDNE